jgi:hypothetical protein
MTTGNSSTTINGNSAPKKEWRQSTLQELPAQQAANTRDRLLTDEERKELFAYAITEWAAAAQERRRDDSLDRHEIAGLDSFHRLIGQRNALLELIARYYRTNRKADCAPGLLVIITTFSDSRDGCCWISTDRMAEFLGRGRDSVSEALQRLFDDGLVNREGAEKGGMPRRYWPVINRAFIDPKLAIWNFMDALSAPPAPRGRLKKGVGSTPHLSTKVQSEHDTFTEKGAGMIRHLSEQRCGAEDAKVSDRADRNLLRNLLVDRKEEERESRAVTIADKTPEDHLAIFDRVPALLKVADRWQPADGQQEIAQRRENFVDGLKGKLQTNSVEVVLAALNDAILELQSTDPARKAFGAFCKLFWVTVFPKAIDRNFKRLLDRLTDVAVSEKRLGAMDDSVADGKAARRAKMLGPPEKAYSPSARGVVKVAGHLLNGEDMNFILDKVPDATPEQAREACIEISDEFKPKPGEAVPIKAVLEKATTHLWKTKLYAEHGKPEEQAGGGAMFYKRGDWFRLSRNKFEEFAKEFPLAFREDGRTNEFYVEAAIFDLCKDCRAPHERYGRGLQEELEGLVRKKFEDRQTAIIASRAAEEERKAQREREFEYEERRKKMWEEARWAAMRKIGETITEWNARGSECRSLVQVEFERMCTEQGVPFHASH